MKTSTWPTKYGNRSTKSEAEASGLAILVAIALPAREFDSSSNFLRSFKHCLTVIDPDKPHARVRAYRRGKIYDDAASLSAEVQDGNLLTARSRSRRFLNLTLVLQSAQKYGASSKGPGPKRLSIHKS
jgi:hypothetical protein